MYVGEEINKTNTKKYVDITKNLEVSFSRECIKRSYQCLCSVWQK